MERKLLSIDAQMVYNFTGTVLRQGFDNAVAIPEFHKELWELACTNTKQVAIAAPRGFAKSTAITFCWLLTLLLFRDKKFAVVISKTEDQAIEFIGTIKAALRNNEDLIALLKPKRFAKDNASDIIVEFEDGYQFRVVAKGSEQEIRGFKWGNIRPDVIVGDDMETDELVKNADRREKFRNTFLNAVIPSLSDTGIIRIVGTVLHQDALLERLLAAPSWLSKRYEAHNPDFSELLWAERFPKERLIALRQSYIDMGNPGGYAQEYLNCPIDASTAYFRVDDFISSNCRHIDPALMTYYAAIDFAISESARADYTVIAVIGIDSKNIWHVVDIRRGRWDGKEIIDEIFSVQLRYQPEIFTAESGAIEKTLGPFLRDEMFKRNCFIALNPMTPVKDKQTRAKPLQTRMRQGGVHFDVDAEWFPALQQEMLRFPRDVHDDQVDALAWVGLSLDKVVAGPTAQEHVDTLYEEEFSSSSFYGEMDGTTGY